MIPDPVGPDPALLTAGSPPPAPDPTVPAAQETPEIFPEIMPDKVLEAIEPVEFQIKEEPAPNQVAPSTPVPESPMVPIKGTFEMQVCVPDGWEDAKIKDYAKANNPPSTEAGWKLFPGPQGRCACPDRKGYTHVWLVA